MVLDRTASAVRVAAAADAALAAGATIGHTYTTAIKGFSATLRTSSQDKITNPDPNTPNRLLFTKRY